MTTEEKRAAIARVYPGKAWKNRVAKMEEIQVIAVYLTFEAEGKFRKDIKSFNKSAKGESKKPEPEPMYPQQLSIDDILR